MSTEHQVMDPQLADLIRQQRQRYGLDPEPLVLPTMTEMRMGETLGAAEIIETALRELRGTRSGTDAAQRWWSRATHKRDLPEYACRTIPAGCWTDDEAYDLLGMAWQHPEVAGAVPKIEWRRAFEAVTGGKTLCEVRDDGYACTVHDEPVKVYRGSFGSEKRGLSWTLDREAGAVVRGPWRHGWKGRTMRVWTTVVSPDRVWAHFTSRGENELVCDVSGLHITEAASVAVPGQRVRHNPIENEWWVACGQGHTHYGEHGAAGLLLRSRNAAGEPVWWLQKRGPHVDHPNTYSTPGGAVRAAEARRRPRRGKRLRSGPCLCRPPPRSSPTTTTAGPTQR